MTGTERWIEDTKIGLYDADGKLLREIPHAHGVFDEPVTIQAGERIYLKLPSGSMVPMHPPVGSVITRLA